MIDPVESTTPGVASAGEPVYALHAASGPGGKTICYAATGGGLFAGAESGVYRSTNGARAWRELEFPVEAAPVLSLAISPRFAADGTVWAGSELGGLFVSRDEGETWACLFDGEIGPVNAVVVAPNTADGVSLLLLAGSGGFLRSDDGGESWEDLSGLLDSGSEASCLAVEPGKITAGKRVFVGHVDGTVAVVRLGQKSEP